MSVSNKDHAEVMEVDADDANPHAYTGSTSIICATAADVRKTLEEMCYCPMCNEQKDPADMVTVCQLPTNTERRETDTKVPPCMTCRVCAKKGAHEGTCDNYGNKKCLACEPTLLLMQEAYTKMGKSFPRGLASAKRNGFCMPRFQPAGNGVQMLLLRKQFYAFADTVISTQQHQDRKNRILATKLEREQRKNAGSNADAPLPSHQERDERSRQLLEEADRAADEPVGRAADEPAGPADEPAGPAEEPAGPADEPAGPAGEEVEDDAQEDALGLLEQLEAESEAGEEDEQAAAPAANDAASIVGEDASGRAAMETEACGAAAGNDEELELRGQKKRRTSHTSHVSTAETALPPRAENAAAASKSSRKRSMSQAQSRKAAAREAAAEDSDSETPGGGLLTPAEEAAATFRCPKTYQAAFRKWKEDGKETADFIDWMTLDKAKKKKVAQDNKANVKNYAKVVEERDLAIQRAENEANEKKAAVKRVTKEYAQRVKEQHQSIDNLMAFLVHIGVQSADIGAMANCTHMADAIQGKYTKICVVNAEARDSGEGSGEGSGEPVDSA